MAAKRKSAVKAFKNIGQLLTLSGVAQKDGRHVLESDLGIIEKAAIIVEGDRLKWLGPQSKMPKLKVEAMDLKGATVLPGFVECHTHAIFAGSRSQEFEWRQTGVSYQEISARGGGILSSMRALRSAKTAYLLATTQKHVDAFVRQGVTCLEIKTGYGLDLKNEIRCLEILKKLDPIRIVPTFLGAHALPPEFKTYEDYLRFLATEILPSIAKRKLCSRVDIFVERGFFPVAESRAYLKKAKEMGFEICLHADQLSLSGGAELACDLDALSADHIIQIQEKEIARLAKSHVTCVLLPTADLYMKCAYPPARAMLDAGARVALATDFNPGTAPSMDIQLVGLLARLQMQMTLPEVIAAYTYNASSALGLRKEIGSLEAGKLADFISIEKDWTDLFYSPGTQGPEKVFLGGRNVVQRSSPA